MTLFLTACTPGVQGDCLFDLGCGKGELCVRAAQQYGIKVVGIEML